MLTYNLIEYSNNYSKTCGSLCLFYRDELALDDDCVLVDLVNNNATDLFKVKEKVTSQTGNNNTLEMSLINCENNLMLP